MADFTHSTVSALLGVFALYAVQASWFWFNPAYTTESLFEDVTPHISLSPSYSEEYGRQIINVTDGVYVAVGFSLANSILLEGPDGLVIIDTTININVAKEILEEFRKISQKKIQAIIFTHFHPDHTYGVEAFIDDFDAMPQIWAHEEFMNQMKITSLTGQIGFIRSRKQFGLYLPNEASLGQTGNLRFDKTFQSTLIFPTHLFHGKSQTIQVAGITLELFHLPGETEDHIAVYWPEKSVIFSGDNIYKAFPNLYAIRGTPARSVMQWAESLDKLINLNANYLVPSHTIPIFGKENIRETLIVYRDAIQYIHDQTVRWMNKGLHPYDIMKRITLPDELSRHPYLEPIYGTIPWSVLGVFDYYMGWFSGAIEDLSPMGINEKSVKMIELAGGKKQMMKKAAKAFEDEDYQWSLELSSHLFKVYPDYEPALQLRTRCLKALAKSQTSINGRQFYLTQVLEDHEYGNAKIDPRKMVKRLPLNIVFEVMTTRLKSDQCASKNVIIVYEFTDISESYSFHLRNGVLAKLVNKPLKWDLKLTTTEKVFREILSKERSAFNCYTMGDIIVDGGILNLKAFQDCFERE